MENQTSFPSSEAKKGIITQELMNGREFANQLLQLVRHYCGSNNSKIEDELDGSFSVLQPFAEDLVKKILKSFTNTLLLFNTTTTVNITDHSSPILTNANSPKLSEHHHHQYFHQSSKTRRGCYKRKRNIETCVKDSPILVEDGHEWRKYGQKVTRNNTKYLRNYYRCSHKYDEGCPAMKQVQRIQESPPLYRTTYYGLHTCNNNHNHITNILDHHHHHSSNSILISFNNNYTHNNSISTVLPSSSSTNKHHHHHQIPPCDHHANNLGQTLVSQYEHVSTVLSSNLDDLFSSSVKLESFQVDHDDDLILTSSDFDEFVRFGL